MRALQLDSPNVDELAAEFLESHRRGANPSIDEYTARFPALADEIREVFPTIARLENLKRHICATPSRAAGAGLPGVTQLGDFRIVRELGRGGMGVVYEAEQVSLRRRVALKILGANLAAEPKLMTRFRREAEAAARLHHTNIVPVFGVGEELGICFYAMQYIDGAPLSAVMRCLRESGKTPSLTEIVGRCSPASRHVDGRAVRDTRLALESTPAAQGARNARGLPEASQKSEAVVDRKNDGPVLPFATTALMVANIADALEFAHQHGVLHRDVKPSNILVDREGAAWITDFGLATHEDGGELTGSGDVLGTLRYMAPEQMDGRTSPQSDVYSLGLTLYELVAGRAAFADTLKAALIEKKSQPLPRLRTANRKIPQDLETIIHKACAPLPKDRYPTARELAADLRAFLADRPIAARRMSAPVRMWRWSRRNPLVASLGTLAVLLMVAVTAAIIIGNRRTNVALHESLDQQARAETNLNRAIAALQEISNDLASRGVPQALHDSDGRKALLQTTPVTAADAEVLDKLLQFFDEFAATNQTDLTAETAKVHLTIGDIRHRLGQLEEAEEDYMRAVDTYIALSQHSPASADYCIAVADAWNLVGTIQAERGRVFSAMKSHEAARIAIESSPAAMAADRGKYTLARTLTVYHQVFARAGASDLFAKPEPDVAWSSAEEDDDHGRSNTRDHHRRTSRRGSDRSRSQGRREPARDRYSKSMERALTILEELVCCHPDQAAYRLSLAQAYRVQLVLKSIEPPQRDVPSPSELGARGIQILEDLIAEYPDDPEYRFELGHALCATVRWDKSLGIDDASCRLEYAATLSRDLVAVYPQVPSYSSLAAVVSRHLATVNGRCGDLDDAERQFMDADAIYADLTERFPEVSLYAIARAQTHVEFAGSLLLSGDRDRAHEESAVAVSLAEDCLPLRDNDPFFRGFLRRLTNRRDWLGQFASLPPDTDFPGREGL